MVLLQDTNITCFMINQNCDKIAINCNLHFFFINISGLSNTNGSCNWHACFTRINTTVDYIVRNCTEIRSCVCDKIERPGGRGKGLSSCFKQIGLQVLIFIFNCVYVSPVLPQLHQRDILHDCWMTTFKSDLRLQQIRMKQANHGPNITHLLVLNLHIKRLFLQHNNYNKLQSETCWTWKVDKM
jgi:hypothetical protein